MIFLVNGSEKEQYSYYINTMHRIRAEVFHERLQWEVNVKNGPWIHVRSATGLKDLVKIS